MKGQGIYLPHIEGNGNHGVQNNDISPEVKEAAIRRTVVFSVVEVPGGVADLLLPVSVPDGKASRQQDEDQKNLQCTQRGLSDTSGVFARRNSEISMYKQEYYMYF